VLKVLAYKEKNQLNAAIETRAPPNLNLSLRNLLLTEITSDILEEGPHVKELVAKIRAMDTFYALRKREAYRRVTGVDAGSQIIPLASRRYAVIGAMAYSLHDGGRFFLQPESLSQPYKLSRDRFPSTVNLLREAKLYETATRFLEEYGGPELLLIDGPLAFSNMWSNAGREEDRRRLIEAVKGLLLKCRRLGVVAAGVVKRPSARYMVHYLGLQDETDLSDSFLMLHALEPGQRTDIFSARTAMRMVSRGSGFMDAMEAPIYSFYARLTREWSIPPIRIDLPAFCLSEIDDVADYCYSTSLYNGVPLAIVKADEAVKVTRRFISDVYSEIVVRVGREVGEVSQLAPYWGEGEWMGA
jgi:hypothetical protein